MYLGEIEIDGYAETEVNTHDPSTGAETDADALPTYRTYEENNDAAINNGNLTKRDDANTTGFYFVRFQVTTGGGFESGKLYFIRINAIVGAIAASMVVCFRCVGAGQGAEDVASNVSSIKGTVEGLNNLSPGQIDTALETYDAVKRSEATSDKNAIITEVDANETKIDNLNNLDSAAVNAACDSALSDYDAPTKTELDAAIAGLNDLSIAQVNASLALLNDLSVAELTSALALLNDLSIAQVNASLALLNDLSAAQVNAECDQALIDYDPSTRTEDIADKAEIIEDLNDIKGTGFVKDSNSLINVTANTPVNLTIGGVEISIEDA